MRRLSRMAAQPYPCRQLVPYGLRWRFSRRKVLCSVCAALCMAGVALAFRLVVQRKPLFFYWSSADADRPWDDDFIASYEARDRRLLEHIFKYYLEPPAGRDVPYALDQPDRLDYSQYNQSSTVAAQLHHRPNGFFVEAGAFDGEHLSNSLYFEKSLNWTGLLIEPSLANYRLLRTKKRKAWTLRACLCDEPRPRRMRLIGAADLGSLDRFTEWWRLLPMQIEQRIELGDVWCFPLISVLLAINQSKVDYLALDIERAEIPVLRSTPIDELDVRVLQVEFSSFYDYALGKKHVSKRKWILQEFMRTHLPQYKEYASVVIDLIYVKS